MAINKAYGYTRVSTDKQKTENQKKSILLYAHNERLDIQKIVEVIVSSKKKRGEREIDQLLENMKEGDTLLVYALDRIGRSTIETLQIIEEIKERKIKLIFIKDNLIIDPLNKSPMNEMLLTMLSGFAQLERSFISERTKAGLQALKDSGVVLGRKKGQIVKSMFDEHREKIEELYTLGLPLSKICNYIGIGTTSSLSKYIKRKKITKKLF